MVSIENNCSLLCAEIVRQACSDYYSFLRTCKKYRISEDEDPIGVTRNVLNKYCEARRNYVSAKNFFLSDWFSWICNADGKVVLKRLDMAVENEDVRYERLYAIK